MLSIFTMLFWFVRKYIYKSPRTQLKSPAVYDGDE